MGRTTDRRMRSLRVLEQASESCSGSSAHHQPRRGSTSEATFKEPQRQTEVRARAKATFKEPPLLAEARSRNEAAVAHAEEQLRTIIDSEPVSARIGELLQKQVRGGPYWLHERDGTASCLA